MFSLFASQKLPATAEYQESRTKFIHYIEQAEEFSGGHPDLSKLVLTAKEEFSLLAGRLRETEESYHQRIKSFLFWFLFNWKISAHGHKTAIELFNNSHEKVALRNYGRSLLNHQHALFLLNKKIKQGVQLKNLFNDKKVVLADVDSFDGVEVGSWFETRIFKVNGYHLLADYMIFHPTVLLKPLRQQVKKLKNQPNQSFSFLELILRLQDYYAKWKNYQKIAVSDIYVFQNQ